MNQEELIEYGMFVDDLSDVLLKHGRSFHWTKLVGGLMNAVSLIAQDPELVCNAYLLAVDPKGTIFKKYRHKRATRTRKPALFVVDKNRSGPVNHSVRQGG